MAFGDPNTPFFSFVDGLSGVPIVCMLGLPDGSGRVPFAILGTSSAKVDLDAGTDGHWSPKGGILTIDGEITAKTAEIVVLGPYLVIEKDGSGTVESDGSRMLDEGETLVTPSFMDSTPVGTRHAALAQWSQADAEEDRDDHVETMIALEDAALGRPNSSL
jgi:hypothetical protein